VVLFFSDQPPTIGRLNVFHSRSYTNPRLQARVLPARSEMVATLIAQIARFARPNIKSTTRVWSTCTNGSVRGIALV
jgi:hypothetical protein